MLRVLGARIMRSPMIVQCTSCQTKFRVPDEKIGDKAVKVRCSKCQAVFGVKRAADGSAAPVDLPAKPGATMPAMPVAPPAPADVTQRSDPFAAFGPPPELAPGERTKAGVYHGGIAASRRTTSDIEVTKPGFAVNALMASKLGAPPPPAAEPALAMPAPALAAPPPAPIDPGSDPFAGLAQELEAQAGTPNDPFAYLNAAAAATSASTVISSAKTPAAPAAAPAPALMQAPVPTAPTDPFASLVPFAPNGGAGGPPPLPQPAPVADPFGGIDVTSPGRVGAAPPPADPFANLDLGAGGAPAAAKPAADPFANLDISAPSAKPAPAAPAPAPAPAPAAASADPFAGLDLSGGAKPASAVTSDPFAGLDLSVANKLATPAPDPLPQSVTFSFESGGGAPAPVAAAPAAPADDFFASAPAPEAPKPASSVDMHSLGADDATTASGEPDRSMFDLPPPPTPSAVEPAASEPLAPAAFEQQPKPGQARRQRPPTTSTKPVAPKKPLGQRVLGVVLNALFVLAVGWGSLLGYATAKADWHFDPALLRPAELGKVVFGGKTAASQLALEDVSSGQYELAGGKTAFFVRGELTNHGKDQVPAAKAHVELLEGEQVIAKADAWAGKPLTPEQVYNLGDANQLKALQAQQQADAQPLAPGDSKPFLAVMLDVPAEKAGRAVRIVPDLGSVTTKP